MEMKAEVTPGDDAGEAGRMAARKSAENPAKAAGSALQSRGLRSSGGADAAEATGAANPSSPSNPQNRLRLFQQDTFERAARRPLVALG